MKISCPYCDGKGELEVKEGEGLASLFEPFVEDGAVGFRLKEAPSLATIDRLPPLNQAEVTANAEAFADVVERIHGQE
jgi:hypothetical protein